MGDLRARRRCARRSPTAGRRRRHTSPPGRTSLLAPLVPSPTRPAPLPPGRRQRPSARRRAGASVPRSRPGRCGAARRGAPRCGPPLPARIGRGSQPPSGALSPTRPGARQAAPRPQRILAPPKLSGAQSSQSRHGRYGPAAVTTKDVDLAGISPPQATHGWGFEPWTTNWIWRTSLTGTGPAGPGSASGESPVMRTASRHTRCSRNGGEAAAATEPPPDGGDEIPRAVRWHGKVSSGAHPQCARRVRHQEPAAGSGAEDTGGEAGVEEVAPATGGREALTGRWTARCHPARLRCGPHGPGAKRSQAPRPVQATRLSAV